MTVLNPSTISFPEAQYALQSLYNPSRYACMQSYGTQSLFATVLFYCSHFLTQSLTPALESVCGGVHELVVQRLDGLHLMAWLGRPPSCFAFLT